ncbi:hypothetical protein [Marinobacter sp.]|uniref:hypothetical protein n=1 Tax=Marinobacter sp. TaxID=50741 RepID=UPI0025C38586|nr:hypothetical protein [Marinobacter sp.]
MNQQPRILIITRNLPPLVGGMERLNWHMADELSQYAKVRVVGPEKERVPVHVQMHVQMFSLMSIFSHTKAA